MAINVVALAQEQTKRERTDKLVKEFRDLRSQLKNATKTRDDADKQITGVNKSIEKLLKQAEDELGEEWHVTEEVAAVAT